MNQQDKVNRHDALIEIRKYFKPCFGDQDKIFAGHQMDEDWAKDIRSQAEKAGVTLAEIEEIALHLLYSWGCRYEHIKTEMTKISKFFGKKLK